MDPVTERVLEAFPPLLYIIIGGLIVGGCCWFYLKKIKSIADKVKEADCAKHGVDIASIASDIKAVKSQSNCVAHGKDIDITKRSLDKILSSIRNIEIALASSNPSTVDVLSKAHSPRQLTDFGSEVLKEYKLDLLLNTNIDYFIEAMNENTYATALDVEQGAYFTLLSKTDESLFNGVKTLVYNSPTYKEVDITMHSICFVMSLELRNEYLQRHPEIL